QIAIGTLLAYGFTSGISRCEAASYTWNVGSGDWSVASNWAPTGVPAASDEATIGSGTVTVNTDTTVSNLVLSGGTIAGGAVLSVVSNFTWTAGTMSGSGTTLMGGSSLLNISTATSKSLERRLQVNGSANWTGGDINFTGGRVDNNGSFTANNSSDMN